MVLVTANGYNNNNNMRTVKGELEWVYWIVWNVCTSLFSFS